MLVLCSDEENTIQAIKWNLRDACQSSMGDEATILGLRHRTFMVQDLQQLSIFFFNWNAFHTKPWFKSKVEVVLMDSGKKIMKGHRSFLTLKIC